MRTLVTGGSGYFGSVLVRELIGRGVKPRVLDLVEDAGRLPEAEFMQGDIRDPAAMRAAVDGMEVVYHCAAQVPLAWDPGGRDGTENLLQAARDAKVKKVVYLSSSAVYGTPEKNPVTEETPPAPREGYGRSKLAAEELCRRCAGDVSIIRPRTILGSGRLGIFQILFEWVYQGSNIPVLGRGDNVYQFVHADDLADACILAAAKPGPSVFNCGAERYGTLRETLEALCAHAKTGSRVRGVPAALGRISMKLSGALRPYHSLMYGRSLYFDLCKIKKELGWSSRHSNEEMMIESYEWYKAHREEVLKAEGKSPHRSAVDQGLLALARRLF
ncbi:MAG: NAD-dependent epimerase/dehydratase family protein [Elusimicrobiota bacterium]